MKLNTLAEQLELIQWSIDGGETSVDIGGDQVAKASTRVRATFDFKNTRYVKVEGEKSFLLLSKSGQISTKYPTTLRKAKVSLGAKRPGNYRIMRLVELEE
jgi:hypothetical protein